MIRKWLKLNTCFAEVLRNSAVPRSLTQKWIFESTDRNLNYYSLDKNFSFNVVLSASTGNINPSIGFVQTFFNQKEKRDAKSRNVGFESGKNEKAFVETPVKTKFFEVKGPSETAFLIEVHEKDLEEVRRDLVGLKGDYFHFDEKVVGWFTMNCIFETESALPAKDQQRLAKVHAISSGSDEVYEETGKFFFVISANKMMRAKRILEKFGYKILKISYRFQPRKKVNLDDRFQKICHRFMKTVESLPKVVSITHNL